MKKVIKRISAILLIVALAIPSARALSVNAGSTTVEDESTGYTTKTWDFDDENDANDFTFYKTSYFADNEDYKEIDFSVQDGYLNSGQHMNHTTDTPSNWWKAHKKALLNECYGGNIKAVSVDMYPIANGVMNGCVYLGVNPGSTGIISPEVGKATDGIEIQYTDKGQGDNKHIISVKLYQENTEYTLYTITYDEADHVLNGDQYKAVPIRITVTITGDSSLQLDIQNINTQNKISPISIDLTTTSTSEETGFESYMFRGQVGVGAWSRGAAYDNLSVTYQEITVSEYDFDDAEQASDFDFYEYGKTSTSNTYNSEMVINNGCLQSAVVENLKGTNTTGYNRKAILRNGYAEVQSASVEIMPISGADTMRGCMFFNFIGAKNSTNGSGDIAVNHVTPNQWYSDINGMVFELSDYSDSDKKITLKVSYYYNGTEYKTSQEWTPDWNENAAQALTMTIDKLTNNLYLCTIALKADPTNSVFALVDLKNLVNGSANAKDVIPDYDKSGTIGLGTWTVITSNTASPAQFDNLVVGGTTLTVGGMDNSEKALAKYQALPTGANVVEGKYVLDWSVTATDMDTDTSTSCMTNTYYGKGDENVTYTYKANVVDPDMLEVTWQEGTSAKGEGYYDVRFAGSLNDFDYADYKRAGFIYSKKSDATLTVNAEGCMTRDTTVLYNSLNANGESVTPDTIYESSNEYPKYFFARVLTGIPSGSTVYVRTFLELSNGDFVYGEPKAVTVSGTEAQ